MGLGVDVWCELEMSSLLNLKSDRLNAQHKIEGLDKKAAPKHRGSFVAGW
jgi:hypothetical protein